MWHIQVSWFFSHIFNRWKSPKLTNKTNFLLPTEVKRTINCKFFDINFFIPFLTELVPNENFWETLPGFTAIIENFLALLTYFLSSPKGLIPTSSTMTLYDAENFFLKLKLEIFSNFLNNSIPENRFDVDRETVLCKLNYTLWWRRKKASLS